MNRIERIQEMLHASPNDNFLCHALALEYIKAGNDVEAEKLFKAILTQSPDYVGSYYHLAKLLERNGNKQEAIIWYTQGMQTAKKLNDTHAYNELQTAYEDLMY
jgi:Tfp pilus assembly protein PilF